MAPEINPANEGLLNLSTLAERVGAWPQDKTIPIVLVSGFAGWADTILGTINYWGGFEDLPATLYEEGYTVILVKIGPLSSNWERACEIFAQLTDGNFDSPNALAPTLIDIDYGQLYSNRYSYNKDAKTKRAVLLGSLPPLWKWGSNFPVHFICHSQGGNTIRMLIELLSGRHTDLHPAYFSGTDSQSWVKSVVTLATPHKGTTITEIFTQLLPVGDEVFTLITRLVASASFRLPRFYDLQLDHWGFSRQGTESFHQMCLRIEDIVKRWWRGTSGHPPHNGFYDNSIVGVNTLNDFAPNPSPTIFYFTMSFDATVDFPDLDPTPADINTFPLNPIFAAPNLAGYPLAIGASIYSRLPGSPHGADYARWFIQVVNNHLGALGYFNKIPRIGPKIPRPDMLPLFLLFSAGMGGYDIPPAMIPPGESSTGFQPNDGIVNTASMEGPNKRDIVDQRNFPKTLSSLMVDGPGKYWHLGINKTMDHADAIGVFTDIQTYREVEHMYKLLAQLVTRL